eukprot:c22546_g1_i1 orf=146-2083(-)
MTMDEPSVVEDKGFYSTSCGYCKSQGPTSVAYGLLAYSLSPYDYQELLDQSWRRSGMILYRPESETSCCPAYTIRLKVDCMEKSNEHVRAMCRMQRYLDGIYAGPFSKEEKRELAMEVSDNHVEPQYETSNINADATCSKHQTLCNKMDEGKQKRAEKDFTAIFLSSEISIAFKECILHGEIPDKIEVPKISVQRFQKASSRRGRRIPSGKISYTCNVAFPCAAALLKQKSDCKIVNSAYSQREGVGKIEDKIIHHQVAVMLADTIALRLQNHEKMSNFRILACNGHLNFILTGSNSLENTKLLTTCSTSGGKVDCKAKQSTEKCLIKPSQPLEMDPIKHKMEIHTTSSVFDPEEFSLYRRYQIAIHNAKPEDVTEVSFRRFLVDTPLTFVPSSKGGDSFLGFGSFHQRYLIDGRLVAVGVIDILPSCLSSNYFFWDPDFAFLSLGKYSALKEIEWIQEARKHCQSLEYYYLGHYIHSCPKMHYKVTYRPSELLCPIRLQWVPFDLARPLLDKQPYACLSDTLHVAQEQDWDCRVEDSASLSSNDNVDSSITNETNCIEERSSENEAMQGCEAASSISPAAAPNAEEDELDNVLLKFEDHYMQFKDLRSWLAAPENSLDELMSKLHNYIKVVGASLAARMAYVLC